MNPSFSRKRAHLPHDKSLHVLARHCAKYREHRIYKERKNHTEQDQCVVVHIPVDSCRKGNYEENRKRIMEYRQSIEDAVREYSYKSNAKAENSGCMLFFLTIIITFFCFCGVFIYMLQT